MKTVVLTHAAGLDQRTVEEMLPEFSVIEVPKASAADVESAGALTEDVVAVVGVTPADDLSGWESVEWAHSAAAGVDAVLESAKIPAQAVLTSATGNGAIPMAEHAMMLMLMLNRNAARWQRAQLRRQWDRFEHGELAGLKVGIVGFGNSGQDLAAKALAFHMTVAAVRSGPVGSHSATKERSSGGVNRQVSVHHGRTGLEEVLRTSDFVVVTCPLTDQTQNLVGEEELSWMKPSASVVVTSRGGVVNEEALIRALEAGQLAGAGLDGFAKEPLDPESPLWNFPNVIVTPHNGATTSGTRHRGAQMALDNIQRWSAGDPLHNVVDQTRGY